MIVQLVLQVIVTVVTAFTSILPSVTMPSWLAGSTVLPASVAGEIGGFVRASAPFLPIDTILTVLVSVFQFWPAIAAYVVFSWVWRHVPTIAGFGTGNAT